MFVNQLLDLASLIRKRPANLSITHISSKFKAEANVRKP